MESADRVVHEDHNEIKIHVKRSHTAKIFRLCEEFGLLPKKTLNMALSVGLSKIDHDLRHAPKSRYAPKLTAGKDGAE
jgi:hypothetical protein